MNPYQKFVNKLIINYVFGSSIAVLGVGSVFTFFTLTLQKQDVFYLIIVLFSSLLCMFIAEFLVFNHHLKDIKIAFKEEKISLEQLEKGFLAAHHFPIKTLKRIMGPHLFGLSLPAVTLTTLFIHFELLALPYRYVVFACGGALLIGGMHALIEFYLTIHAVQTISTVISHKAEKLYGTTLTLKGKIIVSLKKKILFSTVFIGIFPLLLFSLASQVRLQQASSDFIQTYWEWAFGIIILEILFALFSAYLFFRDIEKPILQLQHEMKAVQEGQMHLTSETYSDEFSHLVSGFNHMVQAIQERDQQNKQLSESLITILAATLDARDSYTAGHSNRVTQYSLLLGEKFGLTQDQLSHLRKSAQLHDIGKIGISDGVLLKEGKLTDEEYAQIQKHPELGYDILQQVKPLQDIRSLMEGVKYHHERYDGNGYPEGLKGDAIPLFGRIIAVADAFDAMTSDRPYRKGMSFDTALNIIEAGSGMQWDPVFVKLFIAEMKYKELKNLA
ncbi:HD-GYP domain-containing protein [Bacillus sp. 2205SS5-2]|uniref:HD-GYP domain-containing protein n=1 Tax=Bacillus sp. 2205SS5-2 TaxID=3109031 RepID=UPI00300700D9